MATCQARELMGESTVLLVEITLGELNMKIIRQPTWSSPARRGSESNRRVGEGYLSFPSFLILRPFDSGT